MVFHGFKAILALETRVRGSHGDRRADGFGLGGLHLQPGPIPVRFRPLNLLTGT